MEMYLISNTFNNNFAKNGGALYLSDGINIDKKNIKNIFIENNIFKNNIVENFGGGIYSEYSKLYLANTINNEISYNKAGIMGGGIYSPKMINNTLFDIKNWKIYNNTANTYINNYTTKPYKILMNTTYNDNLKVITGKYLKLAFLLCDEFNNIIEDKNKYYSSISLKLILKEYNESFDDDVDDDDDHNNKKLNFILKGNYCTFVNGNNKYIFQLINNIFLYIL